jgi:hypothetical protein
MTKQSEIPGMEHNMFFEHYVFDPRSNFTEQDVYQIIQFFNIVFDDDVEPPHPKHFDGKVFKPTPDITVTEFADILTTTGISVPDDIMHKLPDELKDQFEDGKFVPFDDFGLPELIEFLTKLMNFRLGTEEFNKLPQHIKRQFIIFTRDGKHWRYGDRQPS